MREGSYWRCIEDVGERSAFVDSEVFQDEIYLLEHIRFIRRGSYNQDVYTLRNKTNNNSVDLNEKELRIHFELYKRHDIPFCLGDRVHVAFQGKRPGIDCLVPLTAFGTIARLDYSDTPVYLKPFGLRDVLPEDCLVALSKIILGQIEIVVPSSDRPDYLKLESGDEE